MLPRLILDTNTVLALWMFRDPALTALREWIERDKPLLLARTDTLEELQRVLAYRQFGLTPDAQDQISTRYAQRVQVHEGTAPLPRLPQCRDGDDQKFVELAWSAAASDVLTRDKALLRVGRHHMFRERSHFLSPEQFQKRLLASSVEVTPATAPQ